MITKERLVPALHELVYVEEGMVTLYASFDEALVNLAEDIEEEKKGRMKKLLSRLYRDSAKHKETVDNMVRRIEGASKNEY